MRTYLLKRLVLVVPTLLGVATIVFVLLRVVPGDVVAAPAGRRGRQGLRGDPRAERARLGLDQPLWRQYVTWITGLGRGDLGLSMWTGRPVAQEIRIRMGLSLELAILATLVAVASRSRSGSWRRLHRGTWIDYVLRVVTLLGLSMPSFWVGVMLILALLLLFRWSPPLTFTSIWADPVANLSQLIWPALAVGLPLRGRCRARMTRSSLLEVLGEDYVRTARAKGLAEQPSCGATRCGTRSCPSSR